jgi:hypothetical protein
MLKSEQGMRLHCSHRLRGATFLMCIQVILRIDPQNISAIFIFL